MKQINIFSATSDLILNLKKHLNNVHIALLWCGLAIITIFTIFTFIYLPCVFYRKHYSSRFVSGVITDEMHSPICGGIPDEKKIDCFPDANPSVTESKCIDRGCCFSIPKNADSNSLPPLNVPYCYYSANYKGYIVTNVSQSSTRIKVQLKRVRPSGFPRDVLNVNLLVTFINNNMFRIKFTDANSKRYEVPVQLHYQTEDVNLPQYDINLDKKSGILTVKRKASGTVIFNTDLSRLVFSDQFLQLTSDLPSSYVYGIGEHYGKLLKDVNWTRFTLINSDLPPVPNHGLYGSHPFYIALEKDGNASGVFLFNSNIMDIILQPSPAVTFRPIGGIFDFYIMLGPSPNEVTKQYSSLVGKTFMPPFWSLGFHLCRFGYKTLNKTRDTMQRNIDSGIPLDVQWNDIDYMEEYKDFTYDKDNFAGLPEFVDDLHDEGRHYVIMTDPGLSNSDKGYRPYDEGLDDDLFIKNANGTTFMGKVWTNGTTVFPDFSHPAAIPFWTRQFQRFHNIVKFDGVWIDMNEPSNFWNGGINGCPESPLESPQYVPGGNTLNTKTVCMSAKHYYETHYNEHNIFGYREALATYQALRNVRKKRPFIISRATFPGQGIYSGHWSGDVYSTWEDMRYSIPSMLNFNLYAIPMVGSDICGFNGNTTVELCARWQSLGAFYPFSRNHNERITIEQDPAALGPIVVRATQNSLLKRYALLPYLYTLFYRSHVFGETVVRPLFLEFPEDQNTYSIDEQFLWGSSVMIIPILYPNTTNVAAYFPKGLWYDRSGAKRNSTGEKMKIFIPIFDIHVSFRAGNIVPVFNADRALSTTEIRKRPFVLMVNLDEKQQSFGELYWDDGDSLDTYENEFYNIITFESRNGKLNNTIVKNGYRTDMNLSIILIAGTPKFPTTVTLNGKNCALKDENYADTNCKFMKNENYVMILLTEPISLLAPFTASWQ